MKNLILAVLLSTTAAATDISSGVLEVSGLEYSPKIFEIKPIERFIFSNGSEDVMIIDFKTKTIRVNGNYTADANARMVMDALRFHLRASGLCGDRKAKPERSR